MPGGRPSDYTPEMADMICEAIAGGQSLHVFCARDGIPDERTIYRWLEKHDEFRQNYVRARERQAERFATEIVAIVDEETDPARARVRMDARKWVASKLLPKKYGDRITQEHDVTDKAAEALKLDDAAIARRVAFLFAKGAAQKED